jgi:hypothetical protein
MSTTTIVMLSLLAVLMCVATVAPLIWAAILDGRYQASQPLT